MEGMRGDVYVKERVKMELMLKLEKEKMERVLKLGKIEKKKLMNL